MPAPTHQALTYEKCATRETSGNTWVSPEEVAELLEAKVWAVRRGLLEPIEAEGRSGSYSWCQDPDKSLLIPISPELASTDPVLLMTVERCYVPARLAENLGLAPEFPRP